MIKKNIQGYVRIGLQNKFVKNEPNMCINLRIHMQLDQIMTFVAGLQ
jgi:uncharacterized membrane protein affecting hemolysin expression